MKWVFFLLLAANLGLAGYVYVNESSPNPDAQIVMQQMNADQIQIVAPRAPSVVLATQSPVVAATPSPVVAATPSPPEPLPETANPQGRSPERRVCLEWGSFADIDLPRVQTALNGLAVGESVRTIEITVPAGYWLYLPPRKSKADMDKKIAELKVLGITEYSPVLEAGPWRYAVSLGMFRNEDGAKKQLDVLQKKGVRSARIGERTPRDTRIALLIVGPSTGQAAKLGELAAEYPGTEVRKVECPAS